MIAPAEVICVERCSTPGVNRLHRSEQPAQSENQDLLPRAPRETDTDLNESLAASRKSHFTVIRPAASSRGSAAANDVPARRVRSETIANAKASQIESDFTRDCDRDNVRAVGRRREERVQRHAAAKQTTISLTSNSRRQLEMTRQLPGRVGRIVERERGEVVRGVSARIQPANTINHDESTSRWQGKKQTRGQRGSYDGETW